MKKAPQCQRRSWLSWVNTSSISAATYFRIYFPMVIFSGKFAVTVCNHGLDHWTEPFIPQHCLVYLLAPENQDWWEWYSTPVLALTFTEEVKVHYCLCPFCAAHANQRRSTKKLGGSGVEPLRLSPSFDILPCPFSDGFSMENKDMSLSATFTTAVKWYKNSCKYLTYLAKALHKKKCFQRKERSYAPAEMGSNCASQE